MQQFFIRKIVGALFIWFASVGCLLAQELTFVKTPLAQDSPLGLIAGITQDKYGFLWLATHTGLHRYDGYELVTYVNNRFNNNSLADNRLECIAADRNGNIWVGIWATGLDRYDPRTGRYTHFRHDPKNPQSLSDDLVTALLEDRDGNLWVGTHKGLNLFHPETGTFTRYQHDDLNTNSISDNKVRALYQDREGTIWVGTGSPWESKPEEGGLNRFNPKTGTFERFMHDPKNPETLFSNWVRAIYEDTRGTFWVGTFGDGLHRMDRRKGTFERLPYDVRQPEKLSRPYIDKERQNDGVNIILEDESGAIWIGTYDSGLNRYDPHADKVRHYRKEANNTSRLDDNNIWAACTTREGVLWFGTANGNLFHLDPLRHRIPHIQTNTPVYSFYEDSAGFMLIGTSKGLLLQNLRNGQRKWYRHNPKDSRSISSDTVYSIYKDRGGSIWLGNASGDLNRFNQGNGTFTRYQHDEKVPTSLSGGPIYAMLEDTQGNFWIATGFGLDKMDRESGTFSHNQSNPNDLRSLSHNSVTSIVEAGGGKLWLGTRYAGGVNLFDPRTGFSKKYLLGSSVAHLLKDSKGVVWVTTDASGIYRYDASADVFTPLQAALDKGVVKIESMVEDDDQNLWFSTKQGLLKLNRARNNVLLLNELYGVKPDPLQQRSGSYKGQDGKLYFGTGTGYYSFYPQNWLPNRHAPLINFTGLRVFNKPVLPGKGSPLKGSLTEASEVEFAPDENVFSFDFTGIHFINPEQNRYLYKLENYDRDWREARTERTAAYYYVPPGRYVLQVKASNSDGVWAMKSIAVRVKPPWWNTWYAYVIYAAILLGAVWNFNRTQRLRLIRRERYRARERELAQAREIERAYKELKRTQAKLVQQEKLASLGELTAGIAHEIQNPLNFINNFAEVSSEMAEELQQEFSAGDLDEARTLSETIRQNLEKIRFHGKRADSIVKGMLQHSRKSTGQKELTDINALANEYLQLSYHGLRAKDKTIQVTLQTDFDPNLEKVAVVPQELGRVLLNLFSNAFYAVQQKKKKLANAEYEPRVEVSTYAKNGHVVIRVKDNGIGMPETLKHKIFQPFFTTKPAGKGTGLGLSLSYDIITKGHGGELLVESMEGEYTEFIIEIPVSVTALPSTVPL